MITIESAFLRNANGLTFNAPQKKGCSQSVATPFLCGVIESKALRAFIVITITLLKMGKL